MSKKSSKPSVKDLVLATKTLSPLDNPQISSTRSGKNKKTEETFSITTYTTGQTVKLTQSKEGVQELTVTKPPECKTKEERDKVIVELAKKRKTQMEIAEIASVSQSTVSNVLNKKKKK